MAALAFFSVSMFFICFLHCRVPRLKLADDSVVFVSVTWSRSGSGFTLMFVAFCITLM